jgi:hypothetical protein
MNISTYDFNTVGNRSAGDPKGAASPLFYMDLFLYPSPTMSRMRVVSFLCVCFFLVCAYFPCIDGSSYNLLSNFTLHEKDEYGVLETYQVFTYQFYFDSPTSGISLPQVLSTDHGDLYLDMRVRPVMYPLQIRDTPYSIPASSMVLQQDVGMGSFTTESSIPPSNLIESSSSPVNGGGSRRLLAAEDASAVDATYVLGSSMAHLFWDGTSDTHHPLRKPLNRMDSFELESKSGGHRRSLKQVTADTWSAGKPMTTAMRDVIERLLKRIDAAIAAIGAPYTPQNWFAKWKSQSPSLYNCAWQPIPGVSETPKIANQFMYFGFGVPCSSTKTTSFVDNLIGTVVDDQSKMVCIAHAYAQFLEHKRDYGQDCRTWPIHILPTKLQESATYGWCDWDGTLRKWTTNMIGFVANHTQERVTLTLTQPSCKNMETTYDGDDSKPVRISKIQNNVEVTTAAMSCTIDPTRPTKTSFAPSGGVFNPATHVVGGVRYPYYDTDECPCYPADQADNEFYYTCNENPWSLVPRLHTSAGLVPPGLEYSVGVLQKCVPVDRTNAFDMRGFCQPFFKDVNLMDTSQPECGRFRGRYADDCPQQPIICADIITLCTTAGAEAGGPLGAAIGAAIGTAICAALDLFRCPLVDVCASSFEAKRVAVEQQRMNFQTKNTEGLISYMKDVSNVTDYISHTLIPQSGAAIEGLNKLSSSVKNATLMAQRIQQVQLNNLRQNNESITNLQKAQDQFARLQESGFANFSGQVDRTNQLLIQLQAVDAAFVNESMAKIAFLEGKEVTNIEQLVRLNTEIDQVYTAMHQAIFTINTQVLQLDAYKTMRQVLDTALTNVRKFYNKEPLVSDWDSGSGSYGQPALNQIPPEHENLTIESYWMYSAETTQQVLVDPTDPMYMSQGVRVHQHNFVQVCKTRSLLDYDQVTVEIDQWRTQLVPGKCWMEMRHSSCVSSQPLGVTLQSILTSRGFEGQFPLFSYLTPDTESAFSCVSGTTQTHHNASADALYVGAQRMNYQYQFDDYIKYVQSGLLPNLVQLSNTALWPGHALFRSGTLGGLWMCSNSVAYAGTDVFTRSMADNTNPYASYGVLPLVSTLYFQFTQSYTLALGASFLLSLHQAVDVGRLPRYGVSQTQFKTQNTHNEQTGTSATSTSGSSGAFIQPTSIATNVIASAQDILLNETFTDHLQQQLENTQLQGFDNVLRFAFAAVAREAIPVHVTHVDDRATAQIELVVSSANTTGGIVYTSDEMAYLNAQLLVNTSYVSLDTVLDENRLINAVSNDLFMVHYWSCLLGVGEQTGCPIVGENADEAQSPKIMRYIYDLDNEDLSPYAHTLTQGEGKVDYGKTRLGGQLVEALHNASYEYNLEIPAYRTPNYTSQVATPAWGRSILSYLNRTGITLDRMLRTETDMEQILHAAAYDEDLAITSANVDVMQHLVNWDPQFYGISLRNYLVSVACNTYIAPSPFDTYKLWDCICMKALSSRRSMCRRLDLFYIAVPTEWLSQESNPDFWSHVYLQPKNSTAQVTIRVPNGMITRILKRSSVNPCPDASLLKIQQSKVLGQSVLTFPRPQYAASPVTLQLTLTVGSNDLNTTDPQSDCAFYATTVNTTASTYDPTLQTWTLQRTLAPGDMQIDNVQIALPSEKCQVRTLRLERVAPMSVCYQYTASVADDRTLSPGISTLSNELPIRNTITALSFAQILSSVTYQLAQINQQVLGLIDIESVKGFTSSRGVLASFLNDTLAQTHPSSNDGSGNIPLGTVLATSANSTTNSFTLIGASLPSNTSITQAVLNQTFFDTFRQRFNQSWNDTAALSAASDELASSLASAADKFASVGANVNAKDLANIIGSFRSSVSLYDDNFNAFQADINRQLASYNLTESVRNVTAALTKSLNSDGMKCLATLAELQTQFPERLLQLQDNLKYAWSLAQAKDASRVFVWYNPGSWLNGVIADDNVRAVVWYIIWLSLTAMTFGGIVLYGRYQSMNGRIRGSFSYFAYNLYNQLSGAAPAPFQSRSSSLVNKLANAGYLSD